MRIFNRENKNQFPEGYDVTESDYYVPEELRADYQAAPAVDDAAMLNTHLPAALEHRTRKTHEEQLAAVLADTGRHPAPMPDFGADVRAAGYVDGDTALAEHLARIAYARNTHQARKAAAEHERKRQAAKCQGCGALDMPTRPASLRNPWEEGTYSFGERAKNRHIAEATIPVTHGRVCQPCALDACRQYVARLSAEHTAAGTTRADAVAALLDREGHTPR